MPRDNIKNFASGTLLSGISSTALAFTLNTGGGANFPNPNPLDPSYFIVAIDTELMVCSAHSGDAFTVFARGFEGTTATTHAANAVVTQSVSAGMLQHLWASVADRYHPDVPAFQRAGIAPSQWDDEFEGNAGRWTQYPIDSGATTSFTKYYSHFSFERSDFNNTSYFLYQPFAPGAGAWQITTKLSQGFRMTGFGPSAAPGIECDFFVCDLTNPTGAANGGNQIRIDMGYDYTGFELSQPYGAGSNINNLTRFIRGANIIAGVWNPLTSVEPDGACYYRISYNGAGFFMLWASADGLTWRGLAAANKFLNAASMGFRFSTLNATNARTSDTVLIDWVRVETGIGFG